MQDIFPYEPEAQAQRSSLIPREKWLLSLWSGFSGIPFKVSAILAATARGMACFASVALLASAVLATAQQQPSSSQAPLPKRTDTVIVQGKIDNNYVPAASSVGLIDASPVETPVSTLSLTQSLLRDQQIRLLTDAVKNDASVGENYAPVGWYPGIEIRGFALDTASGFRINGITIAGDQFIPVENKETIEFLHGIAGLEAGIAAPGGIVNYVTKRPAVMRRIELSTDHRGTAFGAFDWGGFFGSKQQLGLRTNIGGENLKSYVNHADGERGFGTLAADWKFDPNTVLRGDFEYQRHVQKSASGYQLLGGTDVPVNIYPSNMLGAQSWLKPNTYDAINSSIRFDHNFTPDWKVTASVGRSWSLIDDNASYSYGSAVDPNDPNYYLCDPYWFFCKDGSYAVWDYRSPGELRMNDQFQALLIGKLKTGKVWQNFAAGTSLMHRVVKLPKSVFDWIGNDNVYQPLREFEKSSSVPGKAKLSNDANQYAFVVNDRIHLPGRIELTAGGQYVTLHDNYKQTDLVTFENYWQRDKTGVWLPQYSALIRLTDALSAYSTYSQTLSLGPQAPFWALNSNEFLPAYYTRSAEVGAKYAAGRNLLLTADVFRMRAPFFYPKVSENGISFVKEGRETHRGLELSAQGEPSRWVRVNATLAAIQGISGDSETAEFNNKQIINLPHVRSSVFASLSVPYVKGLALFPGWNYTGRKAATRDDVVSVPGYNLFNLGLRYTPAGDLNRVTFRIYADNIGNKRYWKDTGASYGDTFLHPGAPATVRLSAQYVF